MSVIITGPSHQHRTFSILSLFKKLLNATAAKHHWRITKAEDKEVFFSTIQFTLNNCVPQFLTLPTTCLSTQWTSHPHLLYLRLLDSRKSAKFLAFCHGQKQPDLDPYLQLFLEFPKTFLNDYHMLQTSS